MENTFVLRAREPDADGNVGMTITQHKPDTAKTYPSLADYVLSAFPRRHIFKDMIRLEIAAASNDIGKATRRGVGNAIYKNPVLNFDPPPSGYLIENYEWVAENEILVLYVNAISAYDNAFQHTTRDDNQIDVIEDDQTKNYGIFLTWDD